MIRKWTKMYLKLSHLRVGWLTKMKYHSNAMIETQLTKHVWCKQQDHQYHLRLLKNWNTSLSLVVHTANPTHRPPARQHHLLKMLVSPTVCFWLTCQRSSVHRCMDLCPGLQLDSIPQHVCFCANTMLFLLPWLCGTASNEDGGSTNISCIIQGCFVYPVFFSFFHMKLKIVLLISMKNCAGSLVGIT